MNNIASNVNRSEFIAVPPLDNIPLVVAENDFVDQLPRTEDLSELDDEVGATLGQEVVSSVVDTVVGKDIHIDALGDAMEVVHDAREIIVRNGDVRSRANNIRFDLTCGEAHFLIGCALRCSLLGTWKSVAVIEDDGRNCGFLRPGRKGLYRGS